MRTRLPASASISIAILAAAIPARVAYASPCEGAAQQASSLLDHYDAISPVIAGLSETGERPVRYNQEDLERIALRFRREEIQKRARHASSSPASTFFKLINEPDVIEEIGLTGPQQEQVRRIDGELREACRESTLADMKTADLPEKDRVRREAIGRRTREALIRRAEQSIRDEVLRPDQVGRLQQLQWRREGLRAVVHDEELGRRMRLTRAQKALLRESYANAERLKNNPPEELTVLLTLDSSADPDRSISNGAASELKDLGRALDASVWSILTVRNRNRLRESLGPPPKVQTRGADGGGRGSDSQK